MSFPWLASNLGGSPAAAARRLEVAQADLRDRAALFARLGFTPAAAARRLQARVAWDYDPSSGPHRRPAGLDDGAITALVDEVYRRQRP